jgi:hypothetical protein
MHTPDDYRTYLVQMAAMLYEVDLGTVVGTCLAEVRTPLVALTGYPYLVERVAAEPDDCRDLLDQIGYHLHRVRDQYINEHLVDLYHVFMGSSSHQASVDTAFARSDDSPRSPRNEPLDRALQSIIQGMRQETAALQTLLHQIQERCATRRDAGDNIPELTASMHVLIGLLSDKIDIFLEGVLLERIQREYRQ